MDKKLVIGKSKACPLIVPKDPSAKNSGLRKLIGPEEGWEDWVMREVCIGANGTSFNHQHPWAHINYYISGKGVLTCDGKAYPVEAGDFSYVPENAKHQWRNDEQEDLKFICIVSKEGHQ